MAPVPPPSKAQTGIRSMRWAFRGGICNACTWPRPWYFPAVKSSRSRYGSKTRAAFGQRMSQMAEECRALARQSGNNSEHRRMLEQMAESWLQLAKPTRRKRLATAVTATPRAQEACASKADPPSRRDCCGWQPQNFPKPSLKLGRGEGLSSPHGLNCFVAPIPPALPALPVLPAGAIPEPS
jgi:hypothetical protein